MSEAATFLKAILAGEWDAAGVFADWLEEHGDPRGVLLRRRWQRWQKERARGEERDREAERMAWERFEATFGHLRSIPGAVVEANFTSTVHAADADAGFRIYLRTKFHDEWCSIPLDTDSQAYKDS